MLSKLCFFVFGSFTIICSSWSQCQAQYLTVHTSPEDQEFVKQYLILPTSPDSTESAGAIRSTIAQLQIEGYFNASADPLTQTDSSGWETTIHLGPRYQWAYLSAGNLDPVMQDKSGFRDRFFLDSPFSYLDIQKLAKNILSASENTGYPFASVQLTKVKIENEQVSAEINYVPGPYITFGELAIQGTDRIKVDFLASQLRISEGTAYSEKKVGQIRKSIQALPYVGLVGDVGVSFSNDEAIVSLNLKERKSSRLDGLINFLPNENERGKLLLTGQVDVLLSNLMRSGKQLSLVWQRLQLESQRLAISYDHPYLFKSPIQLGLQFDLLKEDVLFLNRRMGIDFSYSLGRGHSIGLFAQMHYSDKLGETNTATAEFEGQLADFRTFNSGLLFNFNFLNDVIAPTKGIFVNGELGIGNKRLIGALSEQGDANLWQPRLSANFGQYYPIGNVLVLHHSLGVGYTDADRLFLNELFRLGGLNSIRGFNENFFFASYYAISTLEARLIFEKSDTRYSYLYLFYDQAVLGHTIQSESFSDVPRGIGAGLSLYTNAGVFNLAYALGATRSTPVNPSLSRIHFGYVSRF